jgi:para-aminobenzoate synthetase
MCDSKSRPRAGRLVLHVRRIGLTTRAEHVFDRLYQDAAYAFWLDSNDPARAGELSRFSFMGDASGPLARVASADVATGRVVVECAEGVDTLRSGFFDWLEADLADHAVDTADLPFGFTLGWVGYLGYELKAECGGTRAFRSPVPDALLIFADRGVVLDHAASEIYLLALAPAGEPGVAVGWLDVTEDRLRFTPAAPPPVPPVRACHLRLRHDRESYLGMISRCVEAISAGESYEICLTNQLTVDAVIDPLAAYRVLRRDNPVPFGALLRFGELSVLSTSPERFLSVSADREVESRPIKGTRPRGTTPAEDERLRRELATSEKDRAENLMIVDLVRNDLSVHAETGSVRVTRIFEVESYATVHQLVSMIRATVAPGISPVRVVRAAFPGGSMTGAPKIRTMELIDELERGPRGVYSGALGYFSLSGAVDLSIVIRTLVVRGDTATFGVGGAIIASSDPAAEFEETAVKATPLLRLLGLDFPGRLRT